MKVINTTKQTILAQDARMADSFLSRMTGLLKTEHLIEGQGLVITRCNSIHMFFMRFAIDAVFADKNNKVVGLVREIKPFRLSKIFFKASYVVELPTGTIDRSRTDLADILQIS